MHKKTKKHVPSEFCSAKLPGFTHKPPVIRTYDEKVLKEDIKHLEKKLKVTAQHILSLSVEYTFLLDQIAKVEENIEIWKIDKDFYGNKLSHYKKILEQME